MDHIKLEGSKIIVIGDTVHDAEVAQQLGSDCILLATDHQSHRRLAKLNYPVLNSLEELAATLT